MKRCSRCGEIKGPCEFRKDDRHRDGLRSECIMCQADYYAQHRDEILAHKAYYRAKHRAESAAYNANRREKLAAYHAKQYIEHRDEILARHAAYNAEHREDKAAHDAMWAKSNPEKRRAYKHCRRARKIGNGGIHTAADIQRQGEIQHWVCWWRGPGCLVDCKDDYHVDHLIPLAKGGHNNPSNIVIACPHCNDSKGAKLPQEWIGKLF